MLLPCTTVLPVLAHLVVKPVCHPAQGTDPALLTSAPSFGVLPLQRTPASALLRDHLFPANSALRVLRTFRKVSSALGGSWRSGCSLKQSHSGLPAELIDPFWLNVMWDETSCNGTVLLSL